MKSKLIEPDYRCHYLWILSNPGIVQLLMPPAIFLSKNNLASSQVLELTFGQLNPQKVCHLVIEN